MHNGKSGVKAIPDGMRGVIPHLIVRGAAKAIDFYKQAFGATEIMRMPGPGGDSIGHAEIRIGEALVFLCDEFPQMGGLSPLARGGSSVTLSMYLEDVDKVFGQAVAAGATVQMPPTDMFWGDRYGKVVDPFGHIWALCTHKEDVAPDEMARRAQAAFANPKACSEQATTV